MGLPGASKVREEKQVDKGVYELLCQRFRLLKLLRGWLCICLFWLGFVEEHFVRNHGSSRPFPPRPPEEGIFPLLKIINLVQIR
jgi:hypothetical protein